MNYFPVSVFPSPLPPPIFSILLYPVIVYFEVQKSVKNSLEGGQLEFEAKSVRDGAWYVHISPCSKK
jgi:hypothetical protein